jgi:hypothetical protein
LFFNFGITTPIQIKVRKSAQGASTRNNQDRQKKVVGAKWSCISQKHETKKLWGEGGH